MKSVPRILPLIGVAIGGVLAVNALAGARDLPGMLSGAKAFAEGVGKPDKTKPAKADAAKGVELASIGEAKDAVLAGASPAPGARPPAVCAPTAAELAKEAGLSPAELQVLQSLGERRGQLDQRESDLNTQLALMAAAEAKVDAKVKALNGLKADIQGLLEQADQRQAAEIDRLVKVYEAMKPKDAAPRMVLLDDSVRIPIAAKMKDRSLSAIVAQMPPADAKKLTEALARRFADAKTMAANAAATANQAANQVPTPKPAAPAAAADPAADGAPDDAAAPTKAADAKPAHKRAAAKHARKAPAHKTAPATAQAANAAAPPAATKAAAAAKPAANAAAPAKAAAASPATPAAATPASAAPAPKAG